jgi:hypothetical protein
MNGFIRAEWFQLPLERELTLHKINQEIDECTDIKTLRESVKSLAYQNARFQNLIGEMLRESMLGEMAEFFDKVTIEEGPAKD